jgi:hypothetical protein
VALEFFRTTGEAGVALADPRYKQHNPAFKKRAEDNKVSDYEEFKNTFLAQGGGTRRSGPGSRRGTANAAGESALRGVHVRHLPREERETGGALGRRGDQPAGAGRTRAVILGQRVL